MTNRLFIPQMRPLFGDEEKNEITDYLNEDGYFTEYRRTEFFESEIAKFTGAKHCIVVNNGTVSLTIAALALGIKPGDEIIVPNYTMIATPNSIKILGAKPVFVDVEPETLVLDIELTKKAISSKTKAIMLVSSNGRSPKAGVEAFIDLSNTTGIPIIEDAAQSLGSLYENGRHIGNCGVVGSFSFSAPKIISTGQGGALITNDDDLAKKIRKLKDFGRASGGNDIHDSIGFNFKFTELQACVGISQMRDLPRRIERKKDIWRLYSYLLRNVEQIKLFKHNLEFCSPWFIDSLVENREGLINFLKENLIGSRVMYPPINSQLAYNQKGNYPVSEFVGNNGLWLPSMVQITDDQIHTICNTITKFYNKL